MPICPVVVLQKKLLSKDYLPGCEEARKALETFQKYSISCNNKTSLGILYRFDVVTTHVVECYVDTPSVVECRAETNWNDFPISFAISEKRSY